MSSKVGIICNIEKDRYFILTEQGDFVMRTGKPPAGKNLGDRISTSANRIWLRGAAIAAALVLMVISSFQLIPGQPGDPEYRISLDINPSLELIYDGDYQLQDWNAFNEEGKALLTDLEKPADLYAGLAAIFERCVELDLVQDEHDVFITAEDDAPLDSDRLLGSFEGHGSSVHLHVLKLPEAEYSSESGSPLRNYLNRKAGTDLEDTAPVAAEALVGLAPGLVTTLEIMPWHNNPVVQAFVEKYLVSGNLVEDMLDTGLSSDEIANLLELAQAVKLSPADLFKELRDSGLSPGQFLRQEESPGNAKAPDLAVPDWLPGLLAQEFGHSPGQISSYLGKGVDVSDLQALLVMEALGGEKLQTSVRSLKGTGLAALIGDSDLDSSQVNLYRQRVEDLVQAAEAWADTDEVEQLVSEYKVSKAEVLYILGRGFSIQETRELVKTKPKGNSSFKEILDQLDGDGPDQGPGPDKETPGNSGGNSDNSPDSPPGQSKGKGNN